MAELNAQSMLDAALEYAARGWHVVPLHTPDERGACSCRQGAACDNSGKHPRTLNGHSDATADEQKIRQWWSMWPNANIGIATGPSGLFVADIDPKDRGQETWRALIARHGGSGRGRVAVTGSGGWHVYYLRGDCQLSQGNSKSGIGIGPGVDYRAATGYVVAPPSLHASGGRYRWKHADDPEPLPAWIPAEIAQQQRQAAGSAAEMQSLRAAAQIPRGVRHRYLRNVAAVARHDGFDREGILALLRAENRKCDPPKSDQELIGLAEWFAKKEPGRALAEVIEHTGLQAAQPDAAEPFTLPTLEEYRASILEIYERGLQRGVSTGWDALDRYFTVLPGGLTVISGFSTMGKTAFLSALVCNLAAQQRWKFGLFTPEMRPYASYFFRLAETWKARSFSRWTAERGSRAELEDAITEMAARLFPLDALNEAAFTFDWFIDAVQRLDDRSKLDAIVVDHWMKLIHPAPRGGESRSDVVIRQVNQLKALCEQRRIHCFLVVHPRVLGRLSDGSLPVADIDDLPDSRGWPALIDNFLVPHRDKRDGDNRVTIHVRKRKPWWIGEEGSCELWYDALTGCYSDSPEAGAFAREVYADYKTRSAADDSADAAPPAAAPAAASDDEAAVKMPF
jgi:hypothetical protein